MLSCKASDELLLVLLILILIALGDHSHEPFKTNVANDWFVYEFYL